MSSDKLIDLALTAIRACRAGPLARQAVMRLGLRNHREVLVFGAGKAACDMAAAVADALGRERVHGLVVAKQVCGMAPEPAGQWSRPGGPNLPASIEVLFAGHPTPDQRSVTAAGRLMIALARLTPKDRALVVLSGGASALLGAPEPGLTLAHLARTTQALLSSGVPIGSLNVVRKHLSIAGGGKLARLTRARLDVLVVSDVLGDDLSAIGSGPFAPDPSTFADALGIARQAHGVPKAVLRFLEQGAAGERPETPKADDACFRTVRHHLIASHATLVSAAVARAKELGYERVQVLPPSADDVSAVADRLLATAEHLGPNGLVISGGEPTVTLPRGHGVGGRNQQLALGVARGLGKRPRPLLRAGPATDGPPGSCSGLQFLAVASDGEDGPTDAAGAIVDEATWQTLRGHGGDPGRSLRRRDAYPALDRAGALVRTGPTGTNVLDLHLLSRRA